jgi:hypothetical protein
MKNLYIEGPPGFGKTELTDLILKGKEVFKAGDPNHFLFGGLLETHQVIWFEDFVYEKYSANIECILSLLDKKPTTVSQKGKNDKTIYFEG